MKEINISEMKEIINKNNCAFLCGNGFSMNFDNGFCDIFDRLYDAHKNLVRNSIYKIEATNIYFKKKCLDNYKNVLQYVRNFSRNRLENIFNDGVIFAKSIIEDKSLITLLKDNNFIDKLEFGTTQLDLVEAIYKSYEDKNFRNVNIEYWSMLIYFYFAIKSIDNTDYAFPKNNTFITLIEVGDKNKSSFIETGRLKDKIIESTYINGFNTYYRMLFSIAIFSNGKHLNLDNLSNMSNLSIEKIKKFLYEFDSIITLNYDEILEKLLPETKVYHLHGKFVINKEEYFNYQSLGLNYGENEYVSFSDILIGDYFYNKTYRSVVNKLSKDKGVNKKTEYYSDTLKLIIHKGKVNTILIFGMNIQNDQHILRYIMCEFYSAKITNPKIIYCYFTEEQKKEFDETFYKVITFGDELSTYARNINVRYINTEEVLSEYFLG